MADLLSIGARALMTNQLVLGTTGNNIANANTPGYSRQSVVLRSVEGQFSGAGYYGNGVEATTVEREYSAFLTRQVQLTAATSAADSKRLESLRQLEDLFQGGENGLGASINELLNSFSDVGSSPNDLSARTVVLARAEEMSSRFRSTAASMQTLGLGVRSEITNMVTDVNSLATRIASLNKQVAFALGAGHTPNDLLDERDKLIKDLNGLVQTTNIPAADGTIGIFLAGSQPLVLGSAANTITMSNGDFGDQAQTKLSMQYNGKSIPLEESMMGGGALTGLLRFQNTDLVDATNLLGRMATALGTALNDQHHLGIDLTGAPGGDLFTLGAMPQVLPATTNPPGATLSVAVQAPPNSGVSKLVPSDYQIIFDGSGTGTIVRATDGQRTTFAGVPITIDGLEIQVSGVPNAGDRFMVTALRSAAANIDTTFSSPRALAMASPVAAAAGAANKGTLTLQSLVPTTADPNLTQPVTLTFNANGTYDVVGAGTGDPTGVSYAPGQTISYNGWTMVLKGTPQPGDTFTVQANTYTTANAGNAEAMMGIRDSLMFDGTAATEGYAALLSELGVRVQGAGYAAAVSKSIATSAASDQASVSGVNLDEEAAKLLQYQQAYQASAKILQISQTIFDSLIQSV